MTTIHILGSGTPAPTHDRFGSSYVIDTGESMVMLDCGPGATAKAAMAGIDVTAIDAVFLTHHHYDHSVDLPCMLMTRWDHEVPGSEPMRIHGPAPTVDLVDGITGVKGIFRHDVRARSEHPSSQRIYQMRGGSLPRPEPRWNTSDLEPGSVVKGNGWTVTAARAAHVQPFHESLAYRFDTAETSIVITGDTARCSEVTELAKGADTMLCCCWDHHDGDDQIDECVAEGMVGNMCGPEDAALMATEAGVTRLVLVHHTPSVAQPGPAARALEIAQENFSGEVIFAHEGLRIEDLATAHSSAR
ncbi:Ribonuclease BN, tRNA processing enzyme [Brevibacterium aurantiacum]|uniref:Ribonuclease BN, tRNA processing enzyme n=1 Tax=Brevibacterium aurantiacum TaxID=273384 RepID=A0A2H1JUB9_BREAU|nr:MBL fold metallo-hydrolase [Brevibacterium aurantiacum]SMX91061.1 Ribonuclease BN, tRNA processing enzyme [Brevibacterium aurantiacum]